MNPAVPAAAFLASRGFPLSIRPSEFPFHVHASASPLPSPLSGVGQWSISTAAARGASRVSLLHTVTRLLFHKLSRHRKLQRQVLCKSPAYLT